MADSGAQYALYLESAGGKAHLCGRYCSSTSLSKRETHMAVSFKEQPRILRLAQVRRTIGQVWIIAPGGAPDGPGVAGHQHIIESPGRSCKTENIEGLKIGADLDRNHHTAWALTEHAPRKICLRASPASWRVYQRSFRDTCSPWPSRYSWMDPPTSCFCETAVSSSVAGVRLTQRSTIRKCQCRVSAHHR